MIHFVLDENLLIAIGHGHLPDALVTMGYQVHLERYQRQDPHLVDTKGECTVAYGSIQFVEQRMSVGYSPGAYYSRERFRCSFYMPKLPISWLGNAEGVYVPFAEFRRRTEQFYRMFGVSRLFIRPDSGKKVFTGLTLDRDNTDQELNSLMQLTSVTGETMIMVTPAKTIKAEYRFYIVRGQVITASRYMVDGEPRTGTDIDPQCLALAEEVASRRWQIELAYTCDIGLFDEPDGLQAKIVELNAFSTSGLYVCDSIALFKAVAAVALAEHNGDVSIEA